MLPENWDSMSPDEKFEARLGAWKSTEGKDFETPEAAKAYEERAQRLADVLEPHELVRLEGVARFRRRQRAGEAVRSLGELEAEGHYVWPFDFNVGNRIADNGGLEPDLLQMD